MNVLTTRRDPRTPGLPSHPQHAVFFPTFPFTCRLLPPWLWLWLSALIPTAFPHPPATDATAGAAAASPGVPPAFTLPEETLRRASQGDEEARAEIALRYLWGEGTPVDYPLALSYARQSSHPAALLTLSRALHFGLGTPRDRDAAVRLRRKALPALEHFSEQGSGVASFCLAHAFLSTRPPDPVTARAYFEKALQQGCPLARAPLGHLLLEAHPSNPARGLELLQEAAREHSAQAARHLATFHRIQGDAANEMRQLQAGAQLLDPHSLVSLGLLRANQGSASEAARLFQRALHQWDEFGEAQTLLGFCFLRGAGVPRDPKRAFELATRATVNGGAESCLILAQLCETGQAATQDYEAAYIWASIAVARGCSDPHSIALRNRLEERLPPADRAKAQARALQLLQELEKQLPRDP